MFALPSPQVISTVGAYAKGITLALVIFSFAPETERRRQIEIAKRNIAERKAQMANRAAAIEAELTELKHQITSAALSPVEILPNPWELETESAPTPTIASPEAPKFQLCLPPVPLATSTTSKHDEMTTRQLKKLASLNKIKNYGKMTKAQLVSALDALNL